MTVEPVTRRGHVRLAAVTACVVSLALAAGCATEAAGTARPAGAVGACSTVTVQPPPTLTNPVNGGGLRPR